MTPAQAVQAGRYDPGDPERGSGFSRSMMTSFNQVPRWGYVALAVVFVGVAWYSYYEVNKKKGG